ncbi:hypothetical protein BGZ82_009548 [Podila clonocystis]|nr:hypothetical protein BGZ82_009548 [Podila clonocystis]
MRFFVLAIALTSAAMVQAAPVDKRHSVVAQGEAHDSPGVLTGNVVNVPASVPVNACGNSFDFTGLLDEASSDTCVKTSKTINMRFSIIAIALAAAAMVQAAPVDKRNEAAAQGVAQNSPGWGSGNVVNIPLTVPVNACGNAVDWIGVANPAEGNTCVNT